VGYGTSAVGKIDEPHLLQPDQLEELRLMTNAEMDSANPFAGILIGQPTLARQLRMGTFAALDQRIAGPRRGTALVAGRLPGRAPGRRARAGSRQVVSPRRRLPRPARR
jgi:hypothetical protein